MTTEFSPGTGPAVEGVPAPAAAPAPVAPPAPTPAPAPAPTPAKETKADRLSKPEPYQYAATGDTSLDMAMAFVGKLGYSPEHPAIQAAFQGDFDILRAELASRDDARGYEAYMTLGEKAYQSLSKKEQDKMQATEQAVLSAVGGQERYAEIQAWAKANADPDERAQINAMFDAGPIQAKAAAIYLAQCYANAHGTVTEPASATRPGQVRQPAASNGALSPQEYQQAIKALVAKVGASKMDGHPEYLKLQQRRLAYRG